MLDPIIGEHPTLRRVKLQLPALATTGETLVIVGEHGTGKTLLAKHIHERSPFAKSKLIMIDCSLLDHRAQRLDLFGGAIGDSNSIYQSPFELPTTVLIKSPDALFMEMQNKLASTIASGEVTRFRSTRKLPVQSRVVIALQRTPIALLRSGTLSHELFDFLNRARRLTVVPLRKRGRDSFLLARHFARQYRGREIIGFDKSYKPLGDVRNIIQTHPWQRNVSELKAFVATSVVPTPQEIMDAVSHRRLQEMEMRIREHSSFSLRSALRSLRSELIKTALLETNGVHVAAAEILGLTEATIRHRREQTSP